MSASDMQRVTTKTNPNPNLARTKLEAPWRNAARCVPDRRLPGGEAGRPSASPGHTLSPTVNLLAAMWPVAAAAGSATDTSRQDVHSVILHIYPTGGTNTAIQP